MDAHMVTHRMHYMVYVYCVIYCTESYTGLITAYVKYTQLMFVANTVLQLQSTLVTQFWITPKHIKYPAV